MFRNYLHCILILIVASATVAVEVPDPVAKVGNNAISQQQYYQTLVDWFGEQVLEEMIRNAVVQQAADKAGVEVTEQEIKKRLAAIKNGIKKRRGLSRQQNFQLWLASKGLSIANLRTRMRRRLLLEKMVSDKVKISDSDVSSYYEKHTKDFRVPTLVKISVISVRTKSQAQKVRNMVTNGDITWGDAARDFSITPTEVGYRPDDDTPIMNAAMELKQDGDISDVVQFGGAYHLVKREDKRTGRTRPFEEVQDAVRNKLRQQKMLKLMEKRRDELIKKAKIKRLLKFEQTEQKQPDSSNKK